MQTMWKKGTLLLCLLVGMRLFPFIVATGYPSERLPQKTVSCYGD